MKTVKRTILMPEWIATRLKTISFETGKSVNGIVNEAVVNIIKEYEPHEAMWKHFEEEQK